MRTGATGSSPSETGNPGGGSVEELPEGVEAVELLPARVRRLTNAEYDASVQALLGSSQSHADSFPPDSRQHGYTMNEAQRVDPILGRAYRTAAAALAEEAVANIEMLAPCVDPGGAARECAATFIDTFVPEAYRRPLHDEERSGLLAVYDVATTGKGLDPSETPEGVFADGIELVLQAVLQSPGFLYVTETGGVDPIGSIQMTGPEIASAVSYLITGGPPDAELAALGADGFLADPEVRAAQARRLAVTPAGRDRAVRAVEEWLELDQIHTIDKDSVVFPRFAELRGEMAAETEAFVRASLDLDGGAVSTLLGAESDVASPELSALYTASGPTRNGLLNRAASLAVNAHAYETAPIWRGTAVMRRVACIDIELPTTLDVEIIPPPPDPTQTHRERLVVHTQDAACANCHDLIDPLGFAFEQFDGIGAFQDTDNGKPVDSSGTVVVGKDFDGAYASSTDLAAALAHSPDVASCFARQIFRASAAEGEGAESAEDGFVRRWSESEASATLVDTLVAYVSDESFIFRSNP